MFERFTERARRVVVLAQEEARILKHDYIGTEHLLLGLIREEESLAARVLQSFGITVERVRSQVMRIVGTGEEVPSGQIPFTPRAKKVLELSLREALSLGHDDIATYHLLLGLLREGEGVAARVLRDLEAQAQDLRDRVIAERDDAPDEGSPAGGRPTRGPFTEAGLVDRLRKRRHSESEAAATTPMFARFTERGQQVVVLAETEARTLEHDRIGTEHILLGLLAEEEGVAAQVLTSLEVTLTDARANVVHRAGAGEGRPPDEMPFTPRAKKVLELALREALSLGHNYIGTEHILLALVREGEGAGNHVLVDLGADSQKVRDEVIRKLIGPAGTESGHATGESQGAPTPREFDIVFEDSPTARCSFCGEGGRSYRSCLAGAEDVRICEDCIELFPRIVSLRREDAGLEQPDEEDDEDVGRGEAT